MKQQESWRNCVLPAWWDPGVSTLITWTLSLLSSSVSQLATPRSTLWPDLKPPRYQEAPLLWPVLTCEDSLGSGLQLCTHCAQRTSSSGAGMGEGSPHLPGCS